MATRQTISQTLLPVSAGDYLLDGMIPLVSSSWIQTVLPIAGSQVDWMSLARSSELRSVLLSAAQLKLQIEPIFENHKL